MWKRYFRREWRLRRELRRFYETLDREGRMLESQAARLHEALQSVVHCLHEEAAIRRYVQAQPHRRRSVLCLLQETRITLQLARDLGVWRPPQQPNSRSGVV
jgi:hypothetical protein